VGCLLLHGFTGSPPEMRPLGEYLHARGMAISAPLLPGHGTAPDDLNRVRWRDWVGAAEAALDGLLATCEAVFAGGLSMGALLAAHLAAIRPGIAGIMLYAPALRVANPFLFIAPVARYIIKQFPAGGDSDLTDPEAPARLWHYGTFPVGGAAELWALQRVVSGELDKITTPAIVFNATRDAMITPDSARRMYDGLGTEDKEFVTLHNSGHCLTVDSEREAVYAQTYGFIVRHTKASV